MDPGRSVAPTTARLRINANTVDHHRCVVTVTPTQIEICGCKRPAITGHLHTWQMNQHISERHRPTACNCVSVNHTDIEKHIRQRHRSARRRHHNGRQIVLGCQRIAGDKSQRCQPSGRPGRRTGATKHSVHDENKQIFALTAFPDSA